MERKLDILGRLVIPMEFRKALGWGKGTRVNMQVSGNKVVITKSECYCAICGSLSELKEVKNVRMCQSCIDEIKVGTFWDVD